MPVDNTMAGAAGGWRRMFARCFFIPQRYVLTLMGFFALVNGYTMRLSLSVAITQMVESPIYINLTDATSEPICAFEDYSYIHRNDLQAAQSYYSDGSRYDWSQKQQGIILSSFYWGYIITQLPGGLLSQRFGGKHVLTVGLFFTAICTMLTPICVQYGGVIGLIILRILMGLGEGIMYTSMTVLLAAWAPLNERTTLGSLAYGGSTVGTIGGTFLSAIILHEYNSWHPVFYFFGAMTMVWCVLFSLLCYNSPETHPFISDAELKYLREELGHQYDAQKKCGQVRTPWREIFTSVPFLALTLSQFSTDWAFCVVVLDLPKYMNDVLHFSIQDNGLYSSIPQLLKLILSLSTGALSDWLIARRYLSITSARKIFICFAALFTGVFIVAASYAECNKLLVVIFFTISTAFQGVPGVTINPLDLSPNYAGILMGIGCTVGAVTGIVAPYIVGVITPHSLLTEWRLIFWITFVLQIVKTAVFAVWGSGDVQPWNSLDDKTPLLAEENGNSRYGSTHDRLLPDANSNTSIDNKNSNKSIDNINYYI